MLHLNLTRSENVKTLSTFLALTVLAVSGFGMAEAAEKHLFYLHGCCIKDKEDPKVKVYETVVQKLRDDGFNVHFEMRYAGIGDNDAAAQAHAARIADEVRSLLAKGTAPENITVAGYSLGSMTALVASSLLENPKVNFVFLAGCPVNSRIKVTIDYKKIAGRALSVYDAKDVKFGSCKGHVPDAALKKEIVLNSGEGHDIFKKIDEQQMKMWKDPLVNWAKSI